MEPTDYQPAGSVKTCNADTVVGSVKYCKKQSESTTKGCQETCGKPSASEKFASGTLTVPISKRHRPWKVPRSTPTSALKNVAGLKLSWERKQALRDERKALLAVVKAAREEDQAAKDAERKRRYEKRKRKEENELRSAKKVTVTNPKTLAKMSKKQFLSYVHKKK